MFCYYLIVFFEIMKIVSPTLDCICLLRLGHLEEAYLRLIECEKYVAAAPPGTLESRVVILVAGTNLFCLIFIVF